MPQVPNQFIQDVLPQGQLQSQRIQSSPADFGAQVGQAMQKLGGTAEQTGDMLAQHALQRQQLVNKARAEDLFSTQYLPSMAQLTNEFYSLKGQTAEDNYQDYVQKLVQLQRDYSSKMPNQISRFLFDEMSKDSNAREVERMSRHAAEQSNAWQKTANDSLINTLVLDGQKHYNDPATLDANRNNIIHQAEYFGALHGIDTSTTENRWQAALDEMYHGAIWNQAQLDPTAAKDMLSQYCGQMNTNSVASLHDKLADAVAEARRNAADSAAQYAYRSFNLESPQGDIDKATSWLSNPDNYTKLNLDAASADSAASQLKAQWARQKQVNEELKRATNDNFDNLATSHKIGPTQFRSWVDPTTKMGPGEERIREVEEWLANPPATTVNDPETFTRFALDIVDRRLSEQRPLNQAYRSGQITEAGWQRLRCLMETSTDPEKSRWFDYAKDAFNARFAGPPTLDNEFANSLPWDSDTKQTDRNQLNWSRARSTDAMEFFPMFMTDLDGAIREQALKGAQIRDLTNKMLDDVERLCIPRRGGAASERAAISAGDAN